MRITQQYRDPKGVPRRIHIIGLGSIGKFVAHSLKSIPNPPPVSLIWHKRGAYWDWMKSPQKITVVTDGVTVEQGSYDAEIAPPIPRFHKQQVIPGRPHPLTDKQISELQRAIDLNENERMADVFSDTAPLPETTYNRARSEAVDEGVVDETEDIATEPIHSLIVCVKASVAISALSAVRHRLTSSSTILFIQNGIGVVDEVDKYVFPDPATRPKYLQGVLTHGVKTNEGFSCTHAGIGTISLGPVLSSSSQGPSDSADSLILQPTSRYLLRTLLRTPILTAAVYTPSSLLSLQLEKLAVNSVINPLTALLDCRNGGILFSFTLTRLMRLLLSETSMVLRSLPELANIPNVRLRFSPARLETLVVGVANITKQNVSSMLDDVRKGRRTEIDYINGWIVKRGEQLGVQCVVNYSMMCAVKAKSNMVQFEKHEELPFVGKLGRPGFEELSGWERAPRK